MAYTKEQLDEIYKKYYEVNQPCNNLLLTLYDFQSNIKNEIAIEYLMHGAGRRVKTINRCIVNIFTIFPPENTQPLSSEQLSDININLHALVINVSGVLDNLAWVFIHEYDLLGKKKEGKVTKGRVGLFYEETQKHFPFELKEYLNSDAISSWFTGYSKEYRDSLAHRIPLYVPPTLLNKEEEKEYINLNKVKYALDLSQNSNIEKYDEIDNAQNKIGSASHFFAQSFKEESKPAYFHAQILADFSTVEEILGKFIEYF